MKAIFEWLWQQALELVGVPLLLLFCARRIWRAQNSSNY